MKNESDILVSLQDRLATPGILRIARGLSHFGEHSLGWLGLGFIGALVDKNHRGRWLKLMAAAFVSHALSVVVKRAKFPQLTCDIDHGGACDTGENYEESVAAARGASDDAIPYGTWCSLPHRCAGRRNRGGRNRAGYRPESCRLWPMWGSRGATERRIAHEREAREVRIRG